MQNFEETRRLLKELHADIVRVLTAPKGLTPVQREILQRAATDVLELSSSLESMRQQRKSPLPTVWALLSRFLPFLCDKNDD